ncbi:MAG: hypothetical protein U0670_20720 [Anaerolineae bacterium]
MGDATTRRQPRPASSTTVQPPFHNAGLLVQTLRRAADGFVRVFERRIIRINAHLRDDRQNGAVDSASAQRIIERLLNHIANRALRIGHNHIEWDGMNFVGNQFSTAHDIADLRPVAMRDDDVPPGHDHVSDVFASDTHCIPLVGDFRFFGRVKNEGVSAYRDGCEFSSHKDSFFKHPISKYIEAINLVVTRIDKKPETPTITTFPSCSNHTSPRNGAVKLFFHFQPARFRRAWPRSHLLYIGQKS